MFYLLFIISSILVNKIQLLSNEESKYDDLRADTFIDFNVHIRHRICSEYESPDAMNPEFKQTLGTSL